MQTRWKKNFKYQKINIITDTPNLGAGGATCSSGASSGSTGVGAKKHKKIDLNTQAGNK